MNNLQRMDRAQINPMGDKSQMEFAYHIRSVRQLDVVVDQTDAGTSSPRENKGRNRSAGLFAETDPDVALTLKGLLPEKIDRIYIGDEFCVHRLPPPPTLEKICRRAAELEMAVTLLTPPLTDDGLDLLQELLAIPEMGSGACEVIANDWGAARFVRQHGSSIPIGVGRLLNKGFKDPRLPDPDAFRAVSDNARTLLRTGTFDHPGFDDLLTSFGIQRMERDLLPFADKLDIPRFPTSVYLPYGYVTTGRYCRTASFQSDKPKFAALSSCGQPCRKISFDHTRVDSRRPLIQSGNAVFYRYSAEMISAIPRHSNVRLVYQGAAI